MTLTNAFLKNALFELESLVTNIPNQSIIEDVSLISIQVIQKITTSSHIYYKPICEPKLSIKVKIS